MSIQVNSNKIMEINKKDETLPFYCGIESDPETNVQDNHTAKGHL